MINHNNWHTNININDVQNNTVLRKILGMNLIVSNNWYLFVEVELIFLLCIILGHKRKSKLIYIIQPKISESTNKVDQVFQK